MIIVVVLLVLLVVILCFCNNISQQGKHNVNPKMDQAMDQEMNQEMDQAMDPVVLQAMSLKHPQCKQQFEYPTYLQQPAGPRGWGYRNPEATYKTLLWEQSKPMCLMPNPEYRKVQGYYNHGVQSAAVPKAKGCSCRPPQPKIMPTRVASSPYANWASTLQP
jgi:hypothetical protein